MFTIDFYEDNRGRSELLELLEDLRKRMRSDKAARVRYNRFARYIQLLQENGATLPENIMKPIIEDIWELRPGDDRVFFFFHRNGVFVLLHSYIKKSQSTPEQEKHKALRERNDYIRRKG